MPEKRGPGRPPGIPASEAQKAAGRENMKKARAAQRARAQARKQGKEIEKPRWKQLEDGDISVRDLSSLELIRKACANNDGSWEGRRHAFNARILQRMEAESVRRARNGLDKLTKPALRALRTRVEDDDNPAQQFAAARMILEYKIGKVPDVVHLGAETEFDRMKQSAFVILRGEENVTPDADDDGHPVVAGEAEWRDEQDG